MQFGAGVGAKPDASLKIVPDVKAIAGGTVLPAYKAQFFFYSHASDIIDISLTVCLILSLDHMLGFYEWFMLKGRCAIISVTGTV